MIDEEEEMKGDEEMKADDGNWETIDEDKISEYLKS